MIKLSRQLALYLQPEHLSDAAAVVRRYFTPRRTGGFTGAYFERLGGGGDRPSVADEFTAEDLVAVSMLSVDVSGNAAAEILIHRRNDLHDLLREIPTARRFSDVTAEEIVPEWPVWRIYDELRAIDKIGPTTASKLLARKRPHLVPVYDSVVETELGLVHGRLWQPLNEWLTADMHANEGRLDKIHAAAELSTEVSLLRVLDVLAWMVGKGYAPLLEEVR